MSVNLREQVEKDLGASLEGDWGLPVVLIDPDGGVYDKSANDPAQPLVGRVVYNRTKLDPETGEQVVVPEPVITLRRTSLSRIPADGEKWVIKFPKDPSSSAPLVEYILIGRPPEGGRAIGFIRLYPQKAVQL